MELPSNASLHPSNPRFFVLGVPPPFTVMTSSIARTSHPSGAEPISESTKRVGRASKIAWGMEGKEDRAAGLGLHRLEAYEPRPEDRPRQPLQRPRRPPVLLDLVVECAEDTGAGALN